MKKIVVILLIIFYSLISFFIFNIYSYNEIDNVLNKNTYTINLENLNVPKDTIIKNSDQYITNILNNISSEYKLNIYKPFFTVKGDKINIDVFSLIGNKEEFLNNFKIKFLKNNNLNNLKDNSYLINSKDNFKDTIGYIDILSKNTMSIKNMHSMNNKGATGTYYISNTLQYNKLKNILNDNGLIVSLNTHKVTMSYEQILSSNKILVIAIAALSILLAIIYIYYLLSIFKKIAIQKSYGYSYLDIFKIYFKELLIFNLIAVLIAFIIQNIFLIGIYDLIGISGYIVYWLKLISIIFIINVLSDSMFIVIIKKFNLRDMLKNKKPTKSVFIYSMIFKIIISFILIGTLVNCLEMVFQYDKNINDLKKWNETKDYVHIEYNQPINILNKNGEEFVLKNKKLYGLLNNSAILCSPPSIYQSSQKNTENFKGFGTYSLFYGNSMLVNSNYLNKNPIYYSNGERVNIKSNYGDYMIILVPEEYKKDQSDLESSFKRWYEFKKYSYINLLRQSKHENLITGKAPIKIYYIKNNQKTFLYNIYTSNKGINYSYNSVIAVVNNENIDSAEYLSYISTGEFMPSVVNGYDELNNAINQSGLENYIMNKPTIYSEIENTIYTLKSYLFLEILNLCILLVTQILIDFFIIISYKESNKMKETVKRLHGYSLWDINLKFNILILIFWSVLGIVLSVIEPSIIMVGTLIIFSIIDICLLNIFLNIFDKHSLKNILIKE